MMYLARINFKFGNGLIRNKKEAYEYMKDVMDNLKAWNCYNLKLISLVKLRKDKKGATKWERLIVWPLINIMLYLYKGVIYEYYKRCGYY